MQKSAVINDIRGATTLGVLGAVLVPIAFVFVLFSTPRSRRQPIFWIQSFALLLAMSQAAVEIASYHVDIETSGEHPISFYNLCAARESLKWLVPWITDSALVFKVLYFYPRTLCSRRKQLSMIAFPSLIKIPRLTVIIINLVIMCRAFATQQTTWAAGLKFQVAEIAMQVADNSYCSSILLYKSWKFFNASSMHVSRTARAQRRARHIVESIAMSFVPALCIQIAFLVVQAIPGDNAVMLVEAQNYLFIFNVYVSLIFSILATSWSSICNVAEHNRAASHMRTLQLSSNSTSSGGKGGAAIGAGHHAGFGKGSGGSTEKELPEHRTLLQYLTTTDEVEELSSVSDGSSEGTLTHGGGSRGDHDMEKGGSSIGSRDSLNFGSFFPRRKASHPQGFGGVMMQQDRQRAMSPRSSTTLDRDNSQSNTAGRRGGLRLEQYDTSNAATRVAPFRSPQVPPFKFQDLSRCGSSNNSTRSGHSSYHEEDGDVAPRTEVVVDQERLSLEDMLRS